MTLSLIPLSASFSDWPMLLSLEIVGDGRIRHFRLSFVDFIVR